MSEDTVIYASRPSVTAEELNHAWQELMREVQPSLDKKNADSCKENSPDPSTADRLANAIEDLAHAIRQVEWARPIPPYVPPTPWQPWGPPPAPWQPWGPPPASIPSGHPWITWVSPTTSQPTFYC